MTTFDAVPTVHPWSVLPPVPGAAMLDILLFLVTIGTSFLLTLVLKRDDEDFFPMIFDDDIEKCAPPPSPRINSSTLPPIHTPFSTPPL